MNLIDRLKNHKLRYREKFGNSYYRQLLRSGKRLITEPLRSFHNGILKAMIGLTYDCQCSCSYCCTGSYPKERKRELSTREVENLIDDICRLPSLCTLVSFFGGEPLLRGDIFDLVKHTTRKGLFTETETNGILLSLENVKRLKRSGLHHIFVRLESSDPKLHDKISNFEGCFRKAREGIEYCVSEKLPCTISTIASKDKIYDHQLERVIDLGKKLGAVSIRILYPTLAGGWLKENNQMLSKEDKDKVRALLRPDFVYLESTYACTKEADRICPTRQKKMFYVSCYGQVQPCPFVPLVFGNIREKKISEILDKMWGYPIFRDTDGNGCPMNNRGFRSQYIAQVTLGVINELPQK